MFIKRNHNTPVGEVHYDWGCGIETVIFLSINKFLSAIEEAVNNNEFFGYDTRNDFKPTDGDHLEHIGKTDFAALVDKQTPEELAEVPEQSEGTPATSETDGQTKTENAPKKDRLPLIIGIILGCICFLIGVYFIFVELPYRKKRSAYLKKKNRRF